MEKLREMRIFAECEELSDHVWRHVAGWDGFSQDTLGRELVNSVDSINTSLAESCSHRSHHGRLHYLYTARGSLFKGCILLEKAGRRGLGGATGIIRRLEQMVPQLNEHISGVETSGG